MPRAYIVVDHDDHEEELQHTADGLRSREDSVLWTVRQSRAFTSVLRC